MPCTRPRVVEITKRTDSRPERKKQLEGVRESSYRKALLRENKAPAGKKAVAAFEGNAGGEGIDGGVEMRFLD